MKYFLFLNLHDFYLFYFIMLQVSNSYFLDFYMRFFNKKIYTHMGVTYIYIFGKEWGINTIAYIERKDFTLGREDTF